MNKKSSYLFVFAILLVASACKSETKVPELETVEVKIKEEKENRHPVTGELIGAKEEDASKEVVLDTPDKEVEDAEVKSKPKSSEIKKTAPKQVVQAQEKVKETKPVIKDKVETTKPEEKSGGLLEVLDEVINSTPALPTPPIAETLPTKETKPEVKDPKPQNPPEEVIDAIMPNHSLLDGLLKKYVSASGVVDYSGLKKDIGKLDTYLSALESSTIDNTWGRDEKLTFWINAYNAYTIKLILDNYPIKSITDLHGGKPWDHKWIKLNGKTLSLNNIENDIIRPQFNEPRIHFAVNCAAKSCPPVLNAAYSTSMLNSQLESQTKKFINNPKFNTLSEGEVKISKIFDWYGGDFGDVAAYIAKYAKTSVKPNAKVVFNEYDWKLNGK